CCERFSAGMAPFHHSERVRDYRSKDFILFRPQSPAKLVFLKLARIAEEMRRRGKSVTVSILAAFPSVFISCEGCRRTDKLVGVVIAGDDQNGFRACHSIHQL